MPKLSDPYRPTAVDWRQRSASLIDLKSDPLAKRNVIRKNPAVAKRLYKKTIEFMRRQGIADEFVAKYVC